MVRQQASGYDLVQSCLPSVMLLLYLFHPLLLQHPQLHFLKFDLGLQVVVLLLQLILMFQDSGFVVQPLSIRYAIVFLQCVLLLSDLIL